MTEEVVAEEAVMVTVEEEASTIETVVKPTVVKLEITVVEPASAEIETAARTVAKLEITASATAPACSLC